MAQFRAKARAVELLGKGQIADLPTAISELWKNGYDAYADNLEATVYERNYKESNSPYFVISDDGKGMNRDDVLEKWFVLGTDSKSRGELDKKGEETLGKAPRIKMGEKGIGRLAVAYLGPQMLMLSKKQNNSLQIFFFDWRILESYDLFLQDINIPVKSLSSISSFEKTFKELKDEFLENFQNNGKWKEQTELKKAIINDCKNLSIPKFLIDEEIDEMLKKTPDFHGTKFIVFQPDEQITDLVNFAKSDEMKDLKDEVSSSYTISTLVALFNLFKTDSPAYKTKLWIANEAGKFDLLTYRSFFNPQDFEDCDHLIEGSFDANGEFKGNIRIYSKGVKHSFFPIKEKKETKYGPFSIKLGYVQPEEDQSLVKDERKRAFEQKLSLYGGLFIYRDGFRVLPYGRIDADFLEFEERRSRSAGEYFFSKRRMFGYIEISRGKNYLLKDKSSREGFINNEAYRTFKMDLISFFKDLAKKYFSTHSESDFKQTQQEDLAKIADAEKTKDEEVKKDFLKKLKSYPSQLAQLVNEHSALIKSLENKSKPTDVDYEELQGLLADISDCKIRFQNLNLKRPVRIKPTEAQKKNLFSYSKEYKKAESIFLDSTLTIENALKKLKVQQLFKEFESRNKFFKNNLNDLFAEYQSKLELVSKKLTGQLSEEKNRFLDNYSVQFGDIVPSKNDSEQIIQSLNLLDSIFTDTREKVIGRITPYLTHLENLSFDIDEDNLVGFYKTKFEEMKEEWNKTYELAQLGIAVEIIDHQFNALYAQLSQNLKDFKNFIVDGKKPAERYSQLMNAFNHLEDNYKLLQPLYRTTGRVRKDVSGLDLYDYASQFFGDKLSENSINLEITPAAKKWQQLTYESIFKPVIINIVNNAIYWLQPSRGKTIRIDAVEDKLLIMNSGVAIEDYSLDQIFKLFYSERPKGRGIGLYLAKQSLNGIGFEIHATNDKKYNLLNGACFVIEKSKTV